MSLSPYMLQRQRLKLGTQATIPKVTKGEAKDAVVRKEIAKVSDKQKVIKAQLKKRYPVYLSTRPWCNIQSPVCTKEATVVNHTRGRGANVLNEDDWEPSCVACNGWIEANHEEAARAGHKKSQHIINQ